MGLASLLTDTPALGLTPGQRRWLSVGVRVAMIFSLILSPQALAWIYLLWIAYPEHVWPPDLLARWAAAGAAFGASVVGLPCALAWERGRGGVLAPLGVALAVAALGLAFAAIAMEDPSEDVARELRQLLGPYEETPAQRAGQAWTAVALGAPAAFASLIALLGGGRRFPRVAVMALAAIALLAAIVLLAANRGAADEQRALLGAIRMGDGDPALERAFWIWAALALAAAYASAVSAVRMKPGPRAGLCCLGALVALFSVLSVSAVEPGAILRVPASVRLAGTAGSEFGASFAAVAWLYAPLAIAIPLAYRLGGAAVRPAAAAAPDQAPGRPAACASAGRGPGGARQRAGALASRLASRLTDTPALGLTPGQRRWLGSGALAVMLASSAAFSVFVLQDSVWEAGDAAKQGLRDRRDAAFAAFGAGAVALACALAWERGRGGVLAPLGVALAAAGLALAIAAAGGGTRLGQAWTAIALGAPAAVASLIAILAPARLDPDGR